MKIARRYPLLILFVCALLSQHQLWSQVRNSEEAAQKMGHLMYFIETYYNDSTSLDQLTDQAIKAIMQQLDPYSVYVPTDELAAMNEPLDGEFEGIGIEFAIVSDTLVVQAVVAGGPSERVGLLPGDRIVGVDGACISSDSLTIDRVRQLLRGPSGSKVQLQVLRKRSASELVFTVTRDKIPLHSLDAAYLTDEGFLYLRLSRFAHKTGEIRYPTIRSRHLLACWASTRSISMSLASVMDFFTAVFVISLNVIRLIFFSSSRLRA